MFLLTLKLKKLLDDSQIMLENMITMFYINLRNLSAGVIRAAWDKPNTNNIVDYLNEKKVQAFSPLASDCFTLTILYIQEAQNFSCRRAVVSIMTVVSC